MKGGVCPLWKSWSLSVLYVRFHSIYNLQGDTYLTVSLVLFAIFLQPLEALPLTFLACLWRLRDKEQSNGMIGMDRFTLEHWVFLYNCYVKYKSARKYQRKFTRKLPDIEAPYRNTIQNLVKKLWTSGILTTKKDEPSTYSINWRKSRVRACLLIN
jgi:hypothetical protein